MKKVIKDFKSTPREILSLVSQQYPFGYDETHLVNFMNSKGEYFHALEIKTPDIIYLIKQDRHLDQHVSDLLEGDSGENELENTLDEVQEADLQGDFEEE